MQVDRGEVEDGSDAGFGYLFQYLFRCRSGYCYNYYIDLFLFNYFFQIRCVQYLQSTTNPCADLRRICVKESCDVEAVLIETLIISQCHAKIAQPDDGNAICFRQTQDLE